MQARTWAVWRILQSAAAAVSLVMAQPPAPVGANGPQTLPLERCLELALQNSHLRPISKFAVEMAEAQHRQALAAYWPQVNANAGYQRLDQPVNFLFPASTLPVPGQSISVPGGAATVTIPANAFGPGFPPSNVQMPVSYPGQTVTTSGQSFAIPQQNIQVLGQDLVEGSMDVKWLLYDGGMRKGLREQSGGYVAVMREAARRTDLEIADSVKRMYWGAVLARQLRQLGEDTLARMEVTLQLTENMYKEGAGKVTKADYLENQVMVESLRSLVAELEKNEVMAEAALANTMGLPWSASVRPSSQEIPFEPLAAKAEELAGSAYQFSPDWEQLKAAIQAAEGGVKSARSGYYPKVALTGELLRWWNGGYGAGLSTAQNRAGWTAGVGLEFPLFDGFLTHNKVSEMLAKVNQLKEQQMLLREGIGLQIKDLVLGLDAAAKSFEATRHAMQSATENREVNTRAYENELVETEKVIRSQLLEALASAQHYKARYDCVALQSKLSLTVGREVRDKLGVNP